MADYEGNKMGGAKRKFHFAIVSNIVRDMFDGTDLYLVDIPALGECKTFKRESLDSVKKII